MNAIALRRWILLGCAAAGTLAATVVVAAAPDAFTFVTRTNVATGAIITSESKTLSGFDGTLPVAVSAGNASQYRIGSGAYTNAPGTILAGQTLTIRHTSATSANTEVVTTVTVGDYATPFRSVTGATDRTPDAFDFGTKSGTPPLTFVESEWRTPTGYNTAVAITPGAGAQYSVDGASWTNASGTLQPGQALKMRHVTAAGALAYTQTHLRVGGIIATFTTRNVDPANLPPTADAGPDQAVAEGAAVTLAGNGSDSEGGALTYAWTQIGGEPVALADADTATARFAAPEVTAPAALAFRLTVKDPSGQAASDDVAVTIADTTTLAIADASVVEGHEGETQLVLTITLSNPQSVPVSVSYATQDGSASAADDYASASGTVAFAPGQTQQQVAVTVFGDAVAEGDETLIVSLSAPVNAALARSAATATIRNDDFPFQAGTGVGNHNPVQAVCVGGGATNCGRRVDPANPGAIRDDLLARAMAITGANGETFIVVTTTNIGYFLAYKPEQLGLNGIYDVRLRIAEATGVPSTNVTVVSDHSHNGPDTIGIWGGVSADYMKITADSVVKAAVDAYRNREPASIRVAAVNQNDDALPGVPRLDSSYDAPPAYDPANGSPDNEFRMLVADGASGRILTMVNYAPHATVLNGAATHQVSGDWAAWAPQEAEAEYGGFGLAAIGTVGGTDWNKSGNTADEKEAEARARLRTLMAAATAALETVVGDEVRVASTFVREEITQPFLLSTYKPGLDRNDDRVPTSGRDVRIDRSTLPPFLTGSVLGTYVSAVRIGDAFVSTFPGEPFGDIEHALKGERRIQGTRAQFLLGGANDFFGYMVKKPETYLQTLKGGATWLGLGCPEHEVVYQGPLASQDPQGCADHWLLMASATFGSHLVCTLQDSAEQLGFPVGPRDAECTALTALDGLAPPPESGSPAAAASSQARHEAVRQAQALADQCRTTPAPAALCEALDEGARTAAVYLGVGTETAAPPPPGTARAGVAVKDASWHLGASAGQFSASGAGIASDRGFDPYGHSTRKVGADILGTRITTRALVVEGANGRRVAIVANDLYLANDLLHRRVAQLLAEHDALALVGGGTATGITSQNLATTSSHSHTSPFYSTPAWGTWIFQDVMDLRFYEYMARQMADAVIEAAAALRPVRMGGATVQANDIHAHTYGPGVSYDGTPAGQPRDYTRQAVTVVTFDDISGGTPQPYANWVIFGVHPEWVWGEEIVNGDITHAVMRMLDRETGAVTLWSQREIGSSGPHKDDRVHAPAARREYQESNFAGYDRAARQLTDSIHDALRRLQEGDPDPHNPHQFAPYQTGFDVAFASQRFAPPATRPYPGISNCNTGPFFNGRPGLPILGFPDCFYDHTDFTEPVTEPVWDALPVPPQDLVAQLHEAGVPIPTSYSATSLTAVQESAAVHLQVFKLGTIAAAMSPNEQFTSQVLNTESRLDRVRDNLWHGFDFACVAQARGMLPPDADAKRAGHCARQNARYPETNLAIPGSLAGEAFERARAQIHNDARGWELDPIYVAQSGDDSSVRTLGAEAEPHDPAQIKGNFTHEEFADHGYDLVISVGMANDYWGYMAEYREYRADSNLYRKALNGLGPHGADFVATRLSRMAANLNGAGVALPFNPLDAAYQAESARAEATARMFGELARAYTAAYDVTLPPDGGAPRITAEPAPTVKRFSAATLQFVGGSNYTDMPYVRVERLVAGTPGDGVWETYGTQEGEVQLQLRFLPSLFSAGGELPLAGEGLGVVLPDPEALARWRAGQFEWVWTATFEAFVSELPDLGARPGITPAGTYRFVVEGAHRGLPSFPNAAPYRLESRAFEVVPWNGITVENLRIEPDGRVWFTVGPVNTFTTFKSGAGDGTTTRQPGYTVGPVDYPDSYTGGISWIRNERQLFAGDEQYCGRCTFRPWADSAQLAVAAIPVTVLAADGATRTLTATQTDGRWVTDGALAPGERAFVPADAIVDEYGETNGAASAVVGGPVEPPPPGDGDADGVVDSRDNCATTSNPDQADADGDGVGDACDATHGSGGVPPADARGLAGCLVQQDPGLCEDAFARLPDLQDCEFDETGFNCAFEVVHDALGVDTAATFLRELFAQCAASPAAPACGAVTSVADGVVPDRLAAASRPLARGDLVYTELDAAPPASRTVDGAVNDWMAQGTRIGGTDIHEFGEHVYTDFLFDAFGADDGADARRWAALALLGETSDRTERIGALQQAANEQLGVPAPAGAAGGDRYGDAADREDGTDLTEVRWAADDDDLYFLARVARLQDAANAAVLILADVDDTAGTLGLNADLTTARFDRAVLLRASGGQVWNMATGSPAQPVAVAASAAGYDNALEARIPRALLERADGKLRVAVMTVRISGNALVPANVAYRFDEPVTIYGERAQALALFAGSVDAFVKQIAIADLVGGRTQRARPGPGYHERQFVSGANISVEGDSENGRLQPYGLYLPQGLGGDVLTPARLTFWTHYRGGKAHSGAAWTPRLIRQLAGDEAGPLPQAPPNLVVTPRGRGTSTWYTTRAHQDVFEVFADVAGTAILGDYASENLPADHEFGATGLFTIDPARVYMSGYSMGGFATYLFTGLYPDLFAAGYSTSGAVTQGAWTGIGPDDEDCGGAAEEIPFVDETGNACFIEANNGRANAQLNYRLLENNRWSPLAIHHGTNDELALTPGAVRMAGRLAELGYRHDFTLFLGYEHFTQAIMDEWADGAHYLNLFARPANPRTVTYKVVPALVKAVNEVQLNGLNGNQPFSFRPDGAYWVDGLVVSDGADGADPVKFGLIEAESGRLPGTTHAAVPRTGTNSDPGNPYASTPVYSPGNHSTPYLREGLDWVETGTLAGDANVFRATLTNLSHATLDLARMGFAAGHFAAPVEGAVTASGGAVLTLANVAAAADICLDNTVLGSVAAGGDAVVAVPDGPSTVRLVPPGTGCGGAPPPPPSGAGTGASLLGQCRAHTSAGACDALETQLAPIVAQCAASAGDDALCRALVTGDLDAALDFCAASAPVPAACLPVQALADVLATRNPWLARKPLNISHRGGAEEFPENTLFAYARSLAVGSDMIEADIYETADGELVVIHDATVDRTTNGSGDVSTLTLAQLKTLDAAYCFRPGGSDCGSEGPFPYRGIATGDVAPPPGFAANDFRIPTLRELLARFPDTLINLELKPDPDSSGRYEARMAALLAEFGRRDDVIVASFVDTASAAFKAQAPLVSTSVPTAQVAASMLTGQGPSPGVTLGHEAFQVPIEFSGIPVINAEFVADAHAQGLAVHAWTIDDCNDMVDLLDLGVDGIMTDRPSLLRSVLDARAATMDRRQWPCTGTPPDPEPGAGSDGGVAGDGVLGALGRALSGFADALSAAAAGDFASAQATFTGTLSTFAGDTAAVATGGETDPARVVGLALVLPSGEEGACTPANAAWPAYGHFMGSLHEHSGYSDGTPATEPRDYYAAGRDLGLDFMGGSEHSDNADVPFTVSDACLAPQGLSCPIADNDDPVDAFRKWDATLEQARAATTASFTAFRGFEWTSDRFGHINVFFSRHDWNAKTTEGYTLSMASFWEWFGTRPELGGGADGLAVFNHPGREDQIEGSAPNLDPAYAFNDFAYRADADLRMVGVETFGKSGDIYDGDNGAPAGGWYAYALDRGWHVGPVGAEDEHGTSWARPHRAKTILVARDRSEGALREAMFARRFYALRQGFNDIRLEFGADGAPMGARLARAPGALVTLSGTITVDAASVAALEIVTAGGAVLGGREAGTTIVRQVAATAAERWYYLRAIGADGKPVAYSAPVWIRSGGAYPLCGEWLAGDLHVHTTYSHDSYGGPNEVAGPLSQVAPGILPGDDNTGPEEFYTLGHTVERQFAIAAARGLDYLAITDHNDVRSQADAGFGAHGVVGLPSYENSLAGHAQMHGARRVYDNPSAPPYDVLADALRADGGVFQINHPAGESVAWHADADWREARDGSYDGDTVPDTIEVWNISWLWQPPAPSGNALDDAVRYWEGWLDRGARVAATGGSDNHYVATTAIQGNGQPTTWVFATERSARGVLEALRAGRTTIAHQPPVLAAPRIAVEADADGDGVYESLQGDAVPVGAALRVRVSDAAGAQLRIVTTGGVALRAPIPAFTPQFEYRFGAPAGARWIRAEVVEPDAAATRATVCDDAVGDQTTYCRSRVGVLALSSALYLD